MYHRGCMKIGRRRARQKKDGCGPYGQPPLSFPSSLPSAAFRTVSGTRALFLVILHRLEFAKLLELFSLERLSLAILHGRRLLVVLALFPFANDALFLDHALEPFERFLKRLTVIDLNECDRKSPPFG